MTNFYYQKQSLQDQSIPKTFYFILKTESLDSTLSEAAPEDYLEGGEVRESSMMCSPTLLFVKCIQSETHANHCWVHS